MSNNYSPNKRQRESEQQQRQRDKEERRALRRKHGPAKVEIVDASEIQGGLPSIESALRAIEDRVHGGGGERAAASIPARLFVGGLSDDVTERDVRALFEAHGPVADVVVMKDRDTQRPRGFGFVTMANRRDAPNAIAALAGTELKGRTLVINVATERGR